MNHRRPNPDELTPDDLFRPEPPAAPAATADEAATQYLPPYPTAAPAAGAGAEDDQRTRQLRVPPTGPPTVPPPIWQPQPQQAPPQYQPYQQPQAYQPYQSQPSYEQYGAQGSGGGRRFSNKAIAIAVVAACAVVGIAAGAVLNAGGSGSANAATTSATASAGQSAGAGDAKSEATALYALLSTAADSRSEAISAVADISACKDVAAAVAALNDSAGKRGALVAKLATLSVDKLTSGQALQQALQQGWQQSQSADQHYAQWGSASAGNCAKKHHPLKNNDALTQADDASYQATTAKQQAAQLWNAVATATGLPQRSASQL